MRYHEAWVDEAPDMDTEYVHVSEVEELESKLNNAKDFVSEALIGIHENKSLAEIERDLEEAYAHLETDFQENVCPTNVNKLHEKSSPLSNPYFQLGAMLSAQQANKMKKNKGE